MLTLIRIVMLIGIRSYPNLIFGLFITKLNVNCFGFCRHNTALFFDDLNGLWWFFLVRSLLILSIATILVIVHC